MNQFTYVAHAGHVHPEKVDAVVTIPPVLLLAATVATVSLIVAVVLITYRMKPAKQPFDTPAPKKDN